MFLNDAIRHGSPVIQQIFDAYYELYHAYGAEDLLRHGPADRRAPGTCLPRNIRWSCRRF